MKLLNNDYNCKNNFRGIMGREERKKIIQKIEQNRNSKVFCYLTSDRPNGAGQVSKDILNIFNDLLRIKDVYKKIDLFIFTLGGDILAGFGLSRLFREYTGYFSVLIPDKCYSAGTLLALGANEIVMTKAASLSPIDPTINNPLNPAIQQPGLQPQILPLSVESIAAFQSLVSDEWGIRKKDLLSEIFKLLAEKIHPISLGEAFKVDRSRKVDSILGIIVHIFVGFYCQEPSVSASYYKNRQYS